MKTLATVIGRIQTTPGTNDKLSMLIAYGDVPGLKEVLRFIYNPYCKTGISTKKLKNAKGVLKLNKPVTWKDAIAYYTEHRTGSDADVAFGMAFIKDTPVEARWLAEAIITQDLKIGVSATTLNKAYGVHFIPRVGCMLGTLYDNVGHTKVNWPCIVTEKLDGVRRILIKENGTCRMYSRSGHEDTGLVEILEEAKYLPNGYIYDGELLAKGTFKDSIAHRQATNSIANMKGEKTGLVFNIFDMVPISVIYSGRCDDSALERKIRLAATLMDESLHLIDKDWARRIQAFGIHQELKHIAAVPILGKVHSLSEAEPIVNAIWEAGGEGIMLNTTIGPYEIKRSKHLLKVKHTEEYVLPIVDFIEGTNKYEEALGALVVEYKGSRVGVGSGFTDHQRLYIWKHRDQYVGKKIEVETFGESTNAQGGISLNCPIFKRFVDEVE